MGVVVTPGPPAALVRIRGRRPRTRRLRGARQPRASRALGRELDLTRALAGDIYGPAYCRLHTKFVLGSGCDRSALTASPAVAAGSHSRGIGPMKSTSFRYLRPESPEEAASALSQLGDRAKVLAGGQSLLAMLNLRLARPEVLIDVGRCGLSGVRVDSGVEIGATTSQNAARASEGIRRAAPLLQYALGFVGHHALRNRGTIGGSIAHADPAAEVPAVLLALGGEVVVLGPAGERTIRADDLFVSSYTTSLADDEVMISVRLPGPKPHAWAFGELSRRRGDFAVAGVAAAFELSSDGTVRDGRVAVFGVDDRPLLVPEATASLLGRRFDDAEAVRGASAAARAAVDPVGDIRGSAMYRKRMTEVVVRRALTGAVVTHGVAE
jgi:aerobic carbon-monoxide dehydrogenase medium subunit